MNIKKLIAVELKNLIDWDVALEQISVPPNSELGDFCLPCFSQAKVLKKSPTDLANEFCKCINESNNKNIISFAEVAGGYLNFFVNKEVVVNNIVKEFVYAGENYGKVDDGKGKTVCFDFSSVNLAKYMHIGHLSTTVIGNCLRNVYNFLGYKTIAINYVGDYGTPFGKMVAAFKLWGNDKDLDDKGVDYIQDLYIKFNIEAQNNALLNDSARMYFKKIEDKDPEVYPLYQRFLKIAIDEIQKIYDLLDIKFDSWRGESFYSDKMQPVINELESKGLLKSSEGARVVNLEDYKLGTCLITKSDGTSLYATRDLAACDDRYNNYNFCKSIYITDVSQKLHFAQFFKVLDLLGRPYAQNLIHAYYGRFSLPDGKIGSRFGKQALLKDIFEYSINKTEQIMREKGNQSKFSTIARDVGVGAVVFSALKNEKIKDVVFNLDDALDFEGETSPYIQYTHARCQSILSKANMQIDINDFDYKQIDNAESFALVKLINAFSEVVQNTAKNCEPCFISRYLIDVSKAFNKYYINNRVIEDSKVNQTRLMLVHATKQVLKSGLKLLGIVPINQM